MVDRDGRGTEWEDENSDCESRAIYEVLRLIGSMSVSVANPKFSHKQKGEM
jgi:hypothetical protein